MNKVLEAVVSGERISTVAGDRATGKTASIIDTVKSLPDKKFLIIVVTRKDLQFMERELSNFRNARYLTCHKAEQFDSIRGYQPDVIIMDDFTEIFSKLNYDISSLQRVINNLKREHTQLVRVG